MAKKRKKDEGESEPPAFDEVKYMRTEMRAGRVAIIVVLWAGLAALVSLALTFVAVVAFFAGLGMMFLMKWVLPFLRIETEEWKRKDWLGHGSTFFFSWLAFWILLLNPPFADLTGPVILGVSSPGAVWTGCGGTLDVTPGNVTLNVTASDNVAVSRVSVTVGGGSPILLDPKGGTLWRKSISVPVTPSTGLVTVVDSSGHSASCAFTFT